MDGSMSRPSHGFPGHAAGSDLQTFIRPYLDQYINSSNRIAAGERSVIVMSSRVAQKSYGTEKRFLCPPPTAVLLGNSWWSEFRSGDEIKIAAPQVTVAISGESAPSEAVVEWSTSSGRALDASEPPSDDITRIGRCVGKQLYISDVDERKKKVEALVKVTAPSEDGESERILGVFPSKPIKVISKPSKKRQSAKNLELCINHGSTVSLFHRLRSQTVSTKYLCVSGSGASFKGSDGAPLPGLDHRQRGSTPSFVARTASWDMFIMYIVDVNKPTGGSDTPPPPPLQPDYPSPPPNAIPSPANGSQIPIYYNQTVVLQCLISGVVSPVLIIRKVDHSTVVVGGGLQEGAKGVPDSYCAPGEVCGDPVSQLHKIALEVYEPSKAAPEHGNPGASGAFLSCMGEKVNTYRPADFRSWNGFNVYPSSASHSPSLPGSPVASTPSSASSSMPDYFAGANGLPSPQLEYPSSDGGRVRRKRGSLTTAAVAKQTTKATGSGSGRRRVNSTGSGGSASSKPSSDQAMSSGALWSLDIGETAVWTVVGTDQVRYNFYVPPVLYNTPQSSASFQAVTPFPAVNKYLPPERASEAPKANCPSSRGITQPNPLASKLLTLYGENFSKTEPLTVFFGSDPSPHVEVRCQEVLTCLPPTENPHTPQGAKRPIVLVRSDGIVFPTSIMYP
ncbi:hypothetical protein BOTBODRAFT_99586 [Botryobasidium botryosum FD-172 SS1]|uniref:LAG1-DNAbind-domain-containing protein n=1 Tax=Botryobasidium botryosum (strain FD-172 SS1) TaxID=930990 RepID=A0A067N210_BOTB1|nr:hypothetical protein BOTBODRAFT_99586 [Botryobasidium botryosum FD-172 SS1]